MGFGDQLLMPLRVARNLHRQFSESPLTRHNTAGAWGRFIRWQTLDRLQGSVRLAPFANDLVIRLQHGRAAATGVLYLGLPEVESMTFFAHALRPSDLFVDVGANIGTYSVLAAGVAGCHVVAIEPVPGTHRLLVENIRCNQLSELVQALNIAASDKAGSVRMTGNLDSTNHVLSGKDAAGIEVPTATLDTLVQAEGPIFVKMDVEGHEQSALRGAERLLSDSRLSALVMEFGCGAHFGVDEAALYRSVLDHGFESCAYDPESRRLTPCTGGPGRHGNTIFVRDRAAMQRRLETAAPIRVFGTSL